MRRRQLLAGMAATALVPPGLLYARPSDAARAIVLGTAQDAGVPQVNCFRDVCAAVRAGERAAPLVACLGLIDDASGQRFMVDATPDFDAQVAALMRAAGDDPGETTVPLHEHLHGILLTHAHVGHYLGLAALGREIAGARGLPVWASASMGEFLAANAPWDALVRHGNIDLRTLTPGVEVELSPALRVEPFAVVHRAEYTDTLGYLVRGPQRTILWVPDTDTWEGWPVPFDELLDGVDLAFLDGSFWSGDELGHRPQSEVPHPPVSVTLERLRGRAGDPPVRFMHLNHTNPLWHPAAPQHRQLGAGFAVAETGEQHAL